MKKISLIITVFAFLFVENVNAQWTTAPIYQSWQYTTTPNAQQAIATSPDYNSTGSYGAVVWAQCDSVAVSQTTNTTIPSGTLVVYHYLKLTAAVKYTGTDTLPKNPVQGQKVIIFSNKAFYHLFSTYPACIKTDTAGVQYSELFYNGKYWEMIQ